MQGSEELPHPPNPFNTHEVLEKQLEQFAEQQRIKQAQEKQQVIHTDEVLSEVHTEVEARAFNAGLTTEEYHEVFEQYQQDAPAIINLLTFGKAETPEEAHAILMQEAGDEAGKQLVDPVGKVLNMHPLYRHSYPGGRTLEQMDGHDHPRIHIGKKAVGAMWRRESAKYPKK